MRTSLLLLPWLLVGGCTVTCKGPGCAATYNATRLIALRGQTPLSGDTPAWGSAIGTWLGSETEGVNWSVDASGDGTLWIGQPRANRVVRVTDRQDIGFLEPLAEWTTPEGDFGDQLRVADLDNNGVQDLIVTAPSFDLAQGAVHIFFDAQDLQAGVIDASSADLILTGQVSQERAGEVIAICDDTTGDGLPELAFGSPWLSLVGQTSIPQLAGAVTVIASEEWTVTRGTHALTSLGVTWWGTQIGQGVGEALSCRDDIIGDRAPELVIGAPWTDNATGLVAIIELGQGPRDELSWPKTGPLIDVASRLLAPSEDETWFGRAVATAEFDGDTDAELIVGAPGDDGGIGRVQVFLGREIAAGSSKTLVQIRGEAGREELDHIGSAFSIGDLDADGLDDLVIHAPDWREGPNEYDAGRTWVWSGSGAADWSGTTRVNTADWIIRGDTPFQRVGRGVTLSDLDGDGFEDLLMPTQTTP